MADSPKIEVCSHCSGFDTGELRGRAGVKTGCIGKCAGKHPELAGKVYGFLNGAFVVCDTKTAFFAKIDALDAFAAESGRNPLVDAFMSSVTKWREELEMLRAIALDCRLTEELKWGQPCYTAKGRNVVILGGFKAYVALNFCKGALLGDPEGLLVRQTENVQAGRQLRFSGAREIEARETVIRAYVLEAVAIEKAGLDIPPGEKPESPVPEELQTRFDGNPALKQAFYALTPGRQRGYLLYFSGAKQAATRAARIEKYAQKILEGKGFDD